MHLNLLILSISFVTEMANAHNCKKITFKQTKIQVHYSDRNFVYATDTETNFLSTDKRNLSIYGCITPFTTPLTDRNHMGTVQQITINDQNIPILHEEAIAQFQTIWLIGLQNNKIQEIKKAAFSDLPQLEIVHLNSNEIKSMEDEIFHKIPHLHSLYMENNNLQSFEKEWLGNLPELYVFNLAYNKIKSIARGTFETLGSLRILDLSHNGITHLHIKAFDGLRFLEMLDLGYNKINQIENNLFNPTINMRVLNLYYNNLTYIHPEGLASMSQLEDLIVLSNPLTCVCYDEIALWAYDQGVNIKNTYLECRETDNVQNIPVCVTTEHKKCVMETGEDLFSILHSNEFDYACTLKSAVIKVVYD